MADDVIKILSSLHESLNSLYSDFYMFKAYFFFMSYCSPDYGLYFDEIRFSEDPVWSVLEMIIPVLWLNIEPLRHARLLDIQVT